MRGNAIECTACGLVMRIMGRWCWEAAVKFPALEVRAEKDETGSHTDKTIEGDFFLGEALAIKDARQPRWCDEWCEIK